MPLLKKQPFVRKDIPPDLKDNEEVFFSSLTKEIFRNYEEFFERVIVCNSLVWTCAVSGRFGLTYQEALESEEKALKCLESFPENLQIPILYIASLTQRGTLNDMCDDVFLYAKDRYFIGETVLVTVGQKKICEVLKVIAPTKEEITKAQKNLNTEDKNLITDLYRYIVKEVNLDSSKAFTVKGKYVTRQKGVYTRVKNKLFLKQHTFLDQKYRVVKQEWFNKFKLDKIKMSQVFADEFPDFANGSNLMKNSIIADDNKSSDIIAQEHSYDTTQDIERQKAIEIEQKKIEREQKREEMRQKAEYLKCWNKPRDDLLCDDLKPFPPQLFQNINSELSAQAFSDALVILEFTESFKDLLDVQENFPDGITFDFLENALLSTESNGPFSELLNFFLSSVLQLQTEEEFSNELEEQSEEVKEELKNQNVLIKEATMYSSLSHFIYGLSLKELNQLDNTSPYILTEILRMHLLASGGLGHHKNALYRYQQRGGYVPKDDPGLELKMTNPEIIENLNIKTVFELSPEMKAKIIVTLINQLLTFVTLREFMEENLEKVRLLKNDLRCHNYVREDKLAAVKSPAIKNGVKVAAQQGSSDSLTPPQQSKQQQQTDESRQSKDSVSVSEVSVDPKKVQEQLMTKHELMSQIDRHQARGAILPLGRDRSYRRYWMVASLRAILIEDFELLPGTCSPLGGTPISTTLSKAILPSYTSTSLPNADFRETVTPSIDNSIGEDSVALITRRILKELVDRVVVAANTNLTQIETEQFSDQQIRIRLGLCSGNPSDCPVHSTTQIGARLTRAATIPLKVFATGERPIWSLLVLSNTNNANTNATINDHDDNNDEDVQYKDFLERCLNERGFREKQLKSQLLDKSQQLLELLRPPSFSLYHAGAVALNDFVPGAATVGALTETMGSGIAAPEIEFRDMLLDLEERIYVAGLGCVYVENRKIWRDKLEHGVYGDPVFYQSLKNDIDEDTFVQNADTKLVNLRCFSYALAQIAKGIDRRYLSYPLGEDDETKQARLKNAFDNAKPIATNDTNFISEAVIPPPTYFYRNWEYNLLNNIVVAPPLLPSPTPHSSLSSPSTSLTAAAISDDVKFTTQQNRLFVPGCISNLSQLYLHYMLVDRCITWSKSLLKIRCKVCRKKSNPNQLLLCDACNKGYHTYCVKPKIKKIPEGDWFCPTCRQQFCPIVKSRISSSNSSTLTKKMGKSGELVLPSSSNFSSEKIGLQNSASLIGGGHEHAGINIEFPPSLVDDNSDASLVYNSSDDLEELVPSHPPPSGLINSCKLPLQTTSLTTTTKLISHKYCFVCGDDKGDNLKTCNKCQDVTIHHPQCSVSIDAKYMEMGEDYICQTCLNPKSFSATPLANNSNDLSYPKLLSNGSSITDELKSENRLIPKARNIAEKRSSLPPLNQMESDFHRDHDKSSPVTEGVNSTSRSGRKIKRSLKYEDSIVEDINTLDNMLNMPSQKLSPAGNTTRSKKRGKYSNDEYITDLDSLEGIAISNATRFANKNSINNKTSSRGRPKKTIEGPPVAKSDSLNDGNSPHSYPIVNHMSAVVIEKVKTDLNYLASSSRTFSNPNSVHSEEKEREDIYKALKKHPDSWPFIKPVNKTKVPDYYTIIKTPMDLTKIKHRIDISYYNQNHSKTTDVREIDGENNVHQNCNDLDHYHHYNVRMMNFLRDIRLIFTNCWLYNAENAPEYRAALNLDSFLRLTLKDIIPGRPIDHTHGVSQTKGTAALLLPLIDIYGQICREEEELSFVATEPNANYNQNYSPKIKKAIPTPPTTYTIPGDTLIQQSLNLNQENGATTKIHFE